MKRRPQQESTRERRNEGAGRSGVALIDRELRFLEVDGVMASINGYEVSAHMGRQVRDLLPLLAPAVEPLLQHVIATGEALRDCELRGELRPGQPGRWLVSYEPVRARGGTVLAVECFVSELPDGAQESALATARAALHEATAQLAFQARILELLNDAVIAVDAGGAISYWGPGAERLFGASAAEAAGRPAWEVLRPEWPQGDGTPLARATLTAGELWRGEVALHGRDGRRIDAEVAARALPDHASGATYLVVIHDSSERRRAEREAEESRRLFEERAALEAAMRAAQEERALLDTLFSSAPIGFDFVDRELRFVRINEALAANNGLSVEEHLGRTVREVLPELADAVEPLLRQVIETGQPIIDLELHGETRAQPGVPRIWRESLYPVRGADGEVFGVGAVVTEITEHRRSSDERRQLLAAAGEAARRTAALQAITAALAPALTPERVAEVMVEQAVSSLGARSGVLALLDEAGETLAAAYTVGYPQDRLAGWRWPLTARWPLADAVRAGVPLFIRDLDDAQRLYPHLEAVRATIPDVAWANLPLITEGRVEGALSLGFTEPQAFGFEDQAMLTAVAQQCAQALERARLYTAEQRAREAAESAVRERDELIALISHDLKNPLTVIQGQAQLVERRLARGAPDMQRVARSLATISQAASHMSAQIEELLDVAMIRAGRPLLLDLQPTDLVALAQRCVAMVQLNTELHALQLRTSEQELSGSWDGPRIERVVSNLLSNAVKYSPQGGPVLIMLEREHDAGGVWARISVSDTGMGIPAADLPQIFESFHRAANAAGRIKGTGLGLTSAKRIVEQHGGTIIVASVEGEGSTFTVRLPL